jgi:hypothetical protein
MNSELEAAQQLYGHSPAQIYSSTIDAHYRMASVFTPSQGWLSVSQIGNVPFVNTTNSQQCRMSELAPSIPTNTEIDDLDRNYIERQTSLIETINNSLKESNITKDSNNPTLNEYIIEYLKKSPFKDYAPNTGLLYLYKVGVISTKFGLQGLNSITTERINEFFNENRTNKQSFGNIFMRIFLQAFVDGKLSKLPFDIDFKNCKYKLPHNPLSAPPKFPEKSTITASTTLFKTMDTVYSTEHGFFENAQALEKFDSLIKSQSFIKQQDIFEIKNILQNNPNEAEWIIASEINFYNFLTKYLAIKLSDLRDQKNHPF